MRTRWPIQAMFVGLSLIHCAVANAATKNAAKNAPKAEAALVHYRLNGHEVQVPAPWLQLPGPEGVFVTATQESLGSALESAGWRREGTHVDKSAQVAAQALPPTAPHASATASKPTTWTVAQQDSEPVQRRSLRDRVVAWPVAKNRDGPGEVWFVRLLAHNDARPRADADLVLPAIFLTGTSRLARAAALQHGRKALPWIRLRHAPGELRTAQASEPSADSVASADAAVSSSVDADAPSSACTEADAPDKRSYQPDPEAIAACEVHGTLPVHPLAAKQVASSVVWHTAATSKQLALTFDACSTFAIGRFNPRVVAMLRAHHVPATLFVGGHWAEMYPDVLEDLAQDPLFEIGNHTYSHPHMRDLTPALQRQELLWTQQLIFARTGKVPRLFRPPYGEIDDALITSAARNGLYTVEYDLPAGDADDHVTKAHLTNWVVGHSNPGSIVVMHMCRPNNHTADALPAIVQHLRAQGYKFCQVSDMLFNEGKQCQ